jgi:hypothetical protein
MKKRAWLPSVWTAALGQKLDLGLTGGRQNARPGVSRPKTIQASTGSSSGQSGLWIPSAARGPVDLKLLRDHRSIHWTFGLVGRGRNLGCLVLRAWCVVRIGCMVPGVVLGARGTRQAPGTRFAPGTRHQARGTRSTLSVPRAQSCSEDNPEADLPDPLLRLLEVAGVGRRLQEGRVRRGRPVGVDDEPLVLEVRERSKA